MSLLPNTTPNVMEASTAPPSSGRKSRPRCSGVYRVASAPLVSAIADTEAAAAQTATTIPATGNVLASGRRVSSTLLPRYW
jgi:hypothetical protein